MLDVHRLRLLQELHTRKTIAAVAAALGYSGSAVSQQLAQLEREAGVPLLERVGRGVRLTPQALILVEHASAVLHRLEQAEADLASSMPTVRGELRIATFQTAMLALIPPFLDRLAESAPELRVRVRQMEPEPALSALATGDCDLVIIEEFPGHPRSRVPGLDRVPLATDPMRLVVPETLRDKGNIIDLADRPWVLEPEDTPSGRWARALCREAGFEPEVVVSSCDIVSHIRFIETGHAVGFLPDLVWRGQPPTVPTHPLPGQHRRLYSSARSGGSGHPAIVLARAELECVRDGLPLGSPRA
ncbi:LysR family transcriptional regulator [Actinocrispum sp. NPDC049592]|uniref:LysR family transcriptional regulator n=1 Tax=Actinocrispum sp. NPDC049592 TaxID=3154835 RepID=UPI0034413003